MQCKCADSLAFCRSMGGQVSCSFSSNIDGGGGINQLFELKAENKEMVCPAR
jgi:hypothetical protein